MKIKFYWKIINESGLLVDPREQGSHYDKENINGYWTTGFDTEEEAVVTLQAWKIKHKYGVEHEFFLVKAYYPGAEED